jgi:hypothetical protein
LRWIVSVRGICSRGISIPISRIAIISIGWITEPDSKIKRWVPAAVVTAVTIVATVTSVPVIPTVGSVSIITMSVTAIAAVISSSPAAAAMPPSSVPATRTSS